VNRNDETLAVERAREFFPAASVEDQLSAFRKDIYVVVVGPSGDGTPHLLRRYEAWVPEKSPRNVCAIWRFAELLTS
jgi:hypothetical protein